MKSIQFRSLHNLQYTLALSLLLIVATSNPTNADLIDVESTQSGGFYETGTPDNVASFQNYFVGHGTIGGFTTPERRSFFIFDIPELSPGESITGATFSIYLPTEFSVPANFTGGVEVFEITSSAFAAEAILDPMSEMVTPGEIFETFGMGEFYGDLPIFLADPPMGEFPLEMVIPLSPAAISHIEASAGGTFVITGRMATYDPEPGALDEVMFSLSDLVVGGIETDLPKPFLSLTTGASIPEPSSISLLALAGLAIVFRQRRIRR